MDCFCRVMFEPYSNRYKIFVQQNNNTAGSCLFLTNKPKSLNLIQQHPSLFKDIIETFRFEAEGLITCFRHYDSLVKTRSRLTTAITFSRQNDAGSRASTT